MSNNASFAAAMIGCLVLGNAQGAWEAENTPAAPADEPVSILASVTDPVGDTFNPGPDLNELSASTDGTSLNMTLSFVDPIVPPGPSAPSGDGGGNEVVGAIDLDVDQDGATGAPSDNSVAVFCPDPPADFGPEFEVSLFDFDPGTGTAPIFDLTDGTNGAGNTVGEAQVTFNDASIDVVVPNNTISDDGIANIATVIGNLATPTDCAPDGAVLTSSFQGAPAVPALNAWGLLAMLVALALAGGVLLRQRASV